MHAGVVAEAARETFAAMTRSGIAGMELLPGGAAVIHTADGQRHEFDAADITARDFGETNV